MRLNELLKPGEGPVYQWGDKFEQTPDERWSVGGAEPGARSQYFVTEDNQIYAVNFDTIDYPPSVSLSFGNMTARTVNYADLRKLPIKQAVKVLNTVVSAAAAYSAAHGGIPLWVFSTTSPKKAKVYRMIASRIAKQTGGGFREYQDRWGDHSFAVYAGRQGKSDLQQWIHSVSEFSGDMVVASDQENPNDL